MDYLKIDEHRYLPLPIVVNGVEFERRDDCNYRHNYYRMVAEIVKDPSSERDWYRKLLAEDSWFFVYFGLGIKIAHHPFWVQACREVDEGPQDKVLDIWAREHGKSTIITKAKTIQKVLKNPEERIGIFSYVKPAAQSFLRSIKHILENNEFLKDMFPDVLYRNPGSEAFRWSEDVGLHVRRRGSYSEATFEAHGLIEGMPTGKHFTGRMYDDIMTVDMADSPEMVNKVKEMFDMSANLGVEGGWEWVVGTPYHHEDVIAYVEGKKFQDGRPIYTTRKKPATEGGQPNGRPLLLSQERLDTLKSNPRLFRSQQLLDPTPFGEQRLEWRNLEEVEVKDIPSNLFKFMTIDPAGNVEGKDSWAIMVIGVEPFRDDLGASEIFLLDAVIEPMDLIRALETTVGMYSKHGRVLKVGVEKVGAMTFEVHISQALRSRGRCVTIESGNLAILRPGGRSKELRIEAALSWPLLNRKIHISKAVPAAYRERLKLEMQKFPFWHDDGLDALSYVYDIAKDYRFGIRPTEEKPDAWAVKKPRPGTIEDGWMIV